jgi:hypothetical protein
MSPREKGDPGLQALGMTFVAVVLWGATFALALRILRHHPTSVKLRAAAVVIATIGFIPWPLATAKLIRLHDEFMRRVHLIAAAIAFAVSGLFVFVADMLWRAGFVNYVSLMTIWLVMMGVWWVAIMGTEWYYRR